MTVKEAKILNLLSYFKAGVNDISYLAGMTGLSKAMVKSAWKKFESDGYVPTETRGRKKLLSSQHFDFIKTFYGNKMNFNKTITDLHVALVKEFKLEPTFISAWSLYKYMKDISFSYKKIIYKNKNANSSQVKEKRKTVALQIIGAHNDSFDFVYIDEVSFNLDIWPQKGWAPLGKNQKVSYPGKSKNYSAIVAMDIEGILSLKIIKGGVKAPDFCLFIKQLIDQEAQRFRSNKVILFMDNATIHKSKDYMQKLEKFVNIMYNSPYTPQFNPIEFAFSKIKHIVRNQKPQKEDDLVKKNS